jgi:site-specific recombinase XerD
VKHRNPLPTWVDYPPVGKKIKTSLKFLSDSHIQNSDPPGPKWRKTTMSERTVKTRPKPDVSLSAAIKGFLRHVKSAYSKHTYKDYRLTLHRFEAFHGDCLIRQVDVDDVTDFMTHMRETPIAPAGVTAETYQPKNPRYRKPKTLCNIHTGLSALWTWCLKRGYVEEHVVRDVPRPRVNPEPIRPLEPADVVALLRACNESAPWHNKPLSSNYRPTAERDKALIGLMVETAIRVSELCNLRRRDVTMLKSGGRVYVSLGKGNKSREIPFSRRCRNMLNDYLITRPGIKPDDWLFVNIGRNAGQQMRRNAVRQLISRLGERCGVNTSPQHLRITAACLMVTNGMTAWELKRIMGHSNLSTTMRYVRAANVDLDGAMRQASPLNNLRL